MYNPRVIAPDGGWGWVVVFATFTYQFMSGFMRSALSIVYIALLDQFGEGKGPTSWIMSVMSTVTLVIAPVAASLGVKYGHKTVTFVGGFFFGFAFILSYFANSLSYLILTLGVMGGIGSGSSYVSVIVICAMYFNKKRSLAVGLGSSGVGMASFVTPPLITWLEDEFHWRGMMLIIGGCMFNVCVLALLLRPLKSFDIELDCDDNEEIEKSEKENLIKVDVDNTFDNNIQIQSSLTSKEMPQFTEIRDKTEAVALHNSTHINAVSILNRINNLSLEYRRERSHSFKQNATTTLGEVNSKTENRLFSSAQELHKRHHSNWNNSRDNQMQLSRCEGRSVSQLSIMLMGNIYNTVAHDPKLSSMLSLTSKQSVIEKEWQVGNVQGISKHNSEGKPKQMCWHRVGSMFTVYKDLLSNWKCAILMAINALVSFTFMTPVLYIADRAVENGIEKNLAVLAISLFGAGNTFGIVVSGIIADRACVNRVLLYFVSIFLSGLFTSLSVFCGPYLFLHVAYGGLFGIFIGGYISLTPLVLVDILGVDVVGQSYGLCLFFQGVFSLIGTPMADHNVIKRRLACPVRRWLFDITGNYTVPFVLNGCLLILSSLLSVPLMCQSVQGGNRSKS